MAGYDKTKNGYVRAVDLTEKICAEVAEVRGATGLSQNAFISFLVRRKDFAQLAASGRGKMKGARERGTASEKIGCSVPRALCEIVKETAENLGMNREQVVSSALYAIRGKIRSEIFSQPA
jgi:hypothetical protein